MRILLLSLAAVVAVPGASAVQQPTAPVCQGNEYRTLDFWVGDWIALDSDGKAIGTNRVTRDEYGACVITEHFRLNDGSLIGHSLSIYRPGLKRWRQTWVDNQNGYFDLVGGPVAGEDHAFSFETKRVTDRQPFQRMIWQGIKPDGFTWRWQSRTKASDAWADSWVLHYRRKADAGK